MAAQAGIERHMSDIRTIKKYPNRRLYDTAISSYITLADVKQLVMDNIEFQVVDAKTGEPITRNILLQIIAEQEDEGAPIFSTDMLTKIIRFYGDNLQNVMSRPVFEAGTFAQATKTRTARRGFPWRAVVMQLVGGF